MKGQNREKMFLLTSGKRAVGIISSVGGVVKCPDIVGYISTHSFSIACVPFFLLSSRSCPQVHTIRTWYVWTVISIPRFPCRVLWHVVIPWPPCPAMERCIFWTEFNLVSCFFVSCPGFWGAIWNQLQFWSVVFGCSFSCLGLGELYLLLDFFVIDRVWVTWYDW